MKTPQLFAALNQCNESRDLLQTLKDQIPSLGKELRVPSRRTNPTSITVAAALSYIVVFRECLLTYDQIREFDSLVSIATQKYIQLSNPGNVGITILDVCVCE